MVNRYSLADYIVTIKYPENFNISGTDLSTNEIQIGGAGSQGEGSFIGEIKIARNEDDWRTEGDFTGSWVHNKNLNRTGTVDIQLRQVSDDVIRLIQMINIVKDNSMGKGFTITVVPDTYGTKEAYATCTDCFPVKIPDQVFGESAAMQTWSFTSGRVEFSPVIK